MLLVIQAKICYISRRWFLFYVLDLNYNNLFLYSKKSRKLRSFDHCCIDIMIELLFVYFNGEFLNDVME